MIIKEIDRDALRARIRASQPVPHFCLDNFLDASFAESVLASFPSFEEAARVGKFFNALNERGKAQVTDSSTFAEPIAALNRELASPEFLETLAYIFEIPNLMADQELKGAGIHQTGPQGHLDVHLDFNFLKERQLHRRLNILLYFNKDWQPEWGGNFELWDEKVKVCHQSFSPIFNRCIVFATSEVSFHGVTAVRCPSGRTRKSFAAYYYTREAPDGWDGKARPSVFRARPNEVLKGKVLMPLRDARRKFRKIVAGFTGKKSS